MMDRELAQAAVIRNDYVIRWQAKGGRVVGYGCVATPTEILEAAGLLPYRLRALGNSRTEIADAYLSRFNCSYCRSCLQLGLDGTYDFLDGLVETNGCDHLRGMFENWQYVKKYDFFHYLRVPHVVQREALDYFMQELRRFREALQNHFQVEIPDEKLWSVMRRHEQVRERLRTVQDLRARQRPLLTGAETLQLYLLGAAMTAADFVELLDRFLHHRQGRAIANYRARLLLGGSATDEVELVQMIEDLGGLVVADGLCYGARAFWPRRLERQDDPYRALAEMYLQNLFCPRMFDEFPRHRDFYFETIARAKVDGVILTHNKFCDIHGIENVQLRLALEKQGMPVLSLEKEYGALADMGRIKTRVQAFLERIGER